MVACDGRLSAEVEAKAMRPDLRTAGEARLISWLQERQVEETGFQTDFEAVDRATATDPIPTSSAANIAPKNAFHWLSTPVIRMPSAMPGSMVWDSAETESAFRRSTTKPLKKPLVKPMNAAAASARW